jgi:hypothetical protein
MRQIKPTKHNKPNQQNTGNEKPRYAEATNIRTNAAPESSVNERPSEAGTEHAITNQAEQNKITNAESDRPLDEKENEGV